MEKKKNNYKHITRVAFKQDTRLALTGINIKDGYITATDSHRLLKLKTNIPEDINLLLDPKRLEMIEVNYPDTDRLIPEEFNTVFSLAYYQFEILNKMLKSVLAKDRTTFKITVNEKRVRFDISNGISCEVDVFKFEGEEMEVSCNPYYMKELVEFILDQKSMATEVKLVNNLRPFVFSQEGNFEYLITPIRTGS